MRGQSEARLQEIKEQYSAIKVIPIDTDKLDAKLDEMLKKAIKEDGFQVPHGKDEEGNQKYITEADFDTVIFEDRATSGLCLIKGTEMPYDREAVGYSLDDEGNWILEAFKKVKKEKGYSLGMFAVAKTTITMEELKEFAMEEVDLPTFMDSRFNYNDRIASNMSLLMKRLQKEDVI